mmetsp:Transcript_7814/g.10792  ORF Transcript_7814/g.10792 Transcript_7814/m.10792 type:complete len:112 (-) Transcript_7814:1465-1800(-)
MSEMETDRIENENVCPICMDCVTPADGVNLCSDKSHGPSCRACMVAYIENQVKSSFHGTCPLISCPNSAHTRAINNRRKDSTPESNTSAASSRDESSETENVLKKKKNSGI